jgi:hypothetical protein
MSGGSESDMKRRRHRRRWGKETWPFAFIVITWITTTRRPGKFKPWELFGIITV